MAGSICRNCTKHLLNSFYKAPSRFWPVVTQAATLKDVRPPEVIEIDIPEKPKLKFYQKVPDPPHKKEARNLVDLRGPELHKNTLKHKQFGIKALGGGYLRWGHMEMMRNTINRFIGTKPHLFAEWRVEAPYKAITKRSQGTRLGGGKASIDHWVTPVRNGRIILELGGYIEWKGVEKILHQVAHKLPFPAKAVSQEILDKDEEDEWNALVNNENPWTYERIVRGNYLGISRYMGPYDYKWFGKHK